MDTEYEEYYTIHLAEVDANDQVLGRWASMNISSERGQQLIRQMVQRCGRPSSDGHTCVWMPKGAFIDISGPYHPDPECPMPLNKLIFGHQ